MWTILLSLGQDGGVTKGTGFVPKPHPGSLCWGQQLSGIEPEGWGPPGQACLPGGAGAVCSPSCRELPGAGQRAPLQLDPDCPGTLRQLKSSTVQRARAIVSSSFRSHLLQRKTEQKSMDHNHQASPLRPSQRCPPAAECKGETSDPRGLCSLLLQSDEDRHALQEGQQQPQCGRSACLQEGERLFLPAFSTLTCQVANSTIIARWDQWRPLLGTSLQETRCAY